jgi:hypothetical protein
MQELWLEVTFPPNLPENLGRARCSAEFGEPSRCLPFEFRASRAWRAQRSRSHGGFQGSLKTTTTPVRSLCAGVVGTLLVVRHIMARGS